VAEEIGDHLEQKGLLVCRKVFMQVLDYLVGATMLQGGVLVVVDWNSPFLLTSNI
jgi:hypothetical protein